MTRVSTIVQLLYDIFEDTLRSFENERWIFLRVREIPELAAP